MLLREADWLNKRGRTNEAKSALAEVLRLDPGNISARWMQRNGKDKIILKSFVDYLRNFSIFIVWQFGVPGESPVFSKSLIYCGCCHAKSQKG